MSASPAHTETAPGASHEGTEPAHEGGAGGLPQFDPTWWPGQMAWFLIFFAIVLLLMRFVFVPRIGGTIATREGKIEGDIAQARALKEEADVQAQAGAAETAQARAAAQKLASEARAAAGAEVAAKLAEEEAKLAESMAVAEGRIRAARDTAMANVRGIAADTAGAIVAKLTGQAASKAEVDAALVGRA